MKHLLPLIFLFLIQTMLAQSVISIDPKVVNKSFEVNLSDLTLDLEIHTKITNTTNQQVSLRWTRVVKSSPLEWDTQVCDNNACYLPHVSSNIDAALGLNQPFRLDAGKSFDLILHVLPNGTPGEGEFMLIYALASSPNTPIDTVRYSVTVRNRVSSTFDLSTLDIRVFPNPATNYFELSNTTGVDRVTVYNLIGREVRSYDVYAGNQYNVEGLPDGMYLVSLISDRKGTLKTVRLHKRSFRP